MNNGRRLRMFVAVTLPDPVREAVSRLVRELSGRLTGVRWTKSENIHLTLKFLGGAEASSIPPLRDCLDRLAESHLPFPAALEGLGVFPPRGKPRVIWAGVGEGRGRLTALAEELDRDLEGLGFPRETRKYTPHLTLGRFKKTRPGSDPREIAREVEMRRSDSLGSLKVDMIVLMESTLTPGGAIHRIVSRHGAGD